jgi:hypothetical protein
MAYSASGGFPAEYASKLGHIRLIKDPVVQQVIEAFETSHTKSENQPPIAIGHVTLDCPLAQIITVDGSSLQIPHLQRSEREMAFIQIAAQLFKLSTLDSLENEPMMDPRETNRLINSAVQHLQAIFPLAGIHLRGQTVAETIRDLVRRFLRNSGLDQTLKDLVYRSWSAQWPPQQGAPFQACIRPGCDGQVLWQTRNADSQDCPKCETRHFVSDYLDLVSELGEDRPRNEVIQNFRSVAEALTLFTFILRYRCEQKILARTLFLLDGPLLLRANLSRLVEPIRDLLGHQKEQGNPIHMAGVEKGGDFRAYASSIAELLEKPGDYFVPPVQFLVEQISGNRFDRTTYVNRVNYGAKIAARVGQQHTLAINIPTGKFLLEPRPEDLIGLAPVLSTLSRVVSSAHQNALIPLVLINQQASISIEPSASLLQNFVDRLLRGEQLA